MIAIPFIFNSLFNFAVGLLVAKFLGPSEYGRYALALSIGVVLQTLSLDWLRLSATRFYSAHEQKSRPEIRATLDVLYAAIAGLAVAAAIGIALSGIDLPLSSGLTGLAIGTAVSNGLFEFCTALLRARFLDRAYGAVVIAKNLLSIFLTVGGAWYFGSAAVALIGLMLSVVGSLALNYRALRDREASPRLAGGALALRYAAYALPIVLANVLYQSVPMVDRVFVSQVHNFAEAGQLALAFEIGIRIVGSIGSALDAFLFQIAVLAEKTSGIEAARERISRNSGIMFAVIAPVVAGCWLILPSFQRLLIPESFRDSFGTYFTLMLPALLCFALANYAFGPAFQIAHRTLPLIIGGLVAAIANILAILLLPASQDASTFAIAQSISSCAGLAVLIAFLFFLEPMWPRARDIAGGAAATGLMLATVTPLRAMNPGVLTMAVEIGAGVCVYAFAATVFDVAGFRSELIPRLMASPVGRLAARAAARSRTRIG